MIWTPRVTVAAVIEQNGRFLLVEEICDGRIVINQPAGHLEEGESLLDAVMRETLEETGWRFRPFALVGLYRWKNPANEITYLRACFTGECHDHDPARALDEGIVRTLWLTREELDHSQYHARSPLVARCIDDHLAGQRFPLDACIDLGTTPPPR